ncbi:sigma-70 family RNA polymerase sigma factor [Rhodanobacter glycinis]|uniref:Sigma-70 family RNA polymerase sigma factor n=1 Tax=Rhodanobacter glycinis TaxID=582702 RepID=A0A502BUZ3_9GAMM|nr:sigma-70 family RNA polymerase sigma factor [Rhodanobacter glycinis]
MPYTRFPDNQNILVTLDALSDAAIVDRCKLAKGTEQFVPIECVIHMLRRGLRTNNTALTNPLFTQFMERLRRVIPLREGQESQYRVQAYEQVQDRLTGLFAKESTEYQERLDFLEIRFEGALARMLQDARKKASKERHRKAPLIDEETGEIDPQVEQAAGSFNPFDPENISEESYRWALDEAMEELPTTQKRIIEMIRNDVLIDSQDPNVQTISKTLGISEKTVRNQRDKAIVAMKALVNRGEN